VQGCEPMFLINDPIFISLFGAAAVLGVLFVVVRSLRMPTDFVENQFQRNEIRKQLIRNEILLSEEMKTLTGETDQVS